MDSGIRQVRTSRYYSYMFPVCLLSILVNVLWFVVVLVRCITHGSCLFLYSIPQFTIPLFTFFFLFGRSHHRIKTRWKPLNASFTSIDHTQPQAPCWSICFRSFKSLVSRISVFLLYQCFLLVRYQWSVAVISDPTDMSAILSIVLNVRQYFLSYNLWMKLTFRSLMWIF